MWRVGTVEVWKLWTVKVLKAINSETKVWGCYNKHFKQEYLIKLLWILRENAFIYY